MICAREKKAENDVINICKKLKIFDCCNEKWYSEVVFFMTTPIYERTKDVLHINDKV